MWPAKLLNSANYTLRRGKGLKGTGISPPSQAVTWESLEQPMQSPVVGEVTPDGSWGQLLPQDLGLPFPQGSTRIPSAS